MLRAITSLLVSRKFYLTVGSVACAIALQRYEWIAPILMGEATLIAVEDFAMKLKIGDRQ